MSIEPAANERVLVVEDEAEIRDLIAVVLERKGYLAAKAGSVEEALSILSQNDFDLLVVDWMLPGLSGIELIQRLREAGKDCAILMVTAKSDSADIVQALESGADDFVVKPFHPAVLAARVAALLRGRDARPAPAQETPPARSFEKLAVAGIEVRVEAFEVKCGGQPVVLTAKEFKLLVALLRNRGSVVEREALVTVIQGAGVNVISRTVDTHVFSLRKKLGACGNLIESVRGVGYRIGK